MEANFCKKTMAKIDEICDIDIHNKLDCEPNYTTAYNSKKQNVNNHAQNGNQNARSTKYSCENCNMIFANKRNLENHFLTLKHQNNINSIEKNNNCPNCHKEYKCRSGLWKHMQRCKTIQQDQSEPIEEPEDCNKQIQKKQTDGLFTPEFMMLLVKEMKNMMIEQQKVMMEQNKNMTGAMLEQNKNITTAIGEMAGSMTEIAKNVGTHTNTNNSNNTINDNKSFNLNFFLNERCKNAMNLSDFVNGVDISLDDFEETGRIGYVEGLSRIFCKELQKLDIYERPIHCSDAKRETFYVRENNKWEKDENKEMLLSAVKKVGKKNLKVLALWQEKHPGHKDVESKENDRYLRILTNVLCCGDSDEETLANYGKIIKNISLVTVVDKNQERLK
jgi:hypothetical protein